eukprot:c9059_g1_i1.p1 GENE.c9059_g1_i1~~c9059_g1_i1.p1  ORF type:complete len:442 (+),score=97.81 c9059_g1_i1:40-1326(+)
MAEVVVDILSEADLQAIEALRSAVGDVNVHEDQKDDSTMIRFLRARNMDLKEAEKMWRASMIWREKFGVDELLRIHRGQNDGSIPKTPERLVLEKYMSGILLGVDKRGGPVYWERMGMADVGGVVREVGVDEVLKWMVVVAEDGVDRFRQLSKSLPKGQLILHGVVVADMQGLGVSHVSIAGKYAKLTGVLEANYPERMAVCYIVNAPWVFGQIFAIVKPMLSEGTQKKIFVCKSKKDALNMMQQRIAQENIPEFLGGGLAWPSHNVLGNVPKGILSGGAAVPSSRIQMEHVHPQRHSDGDAQKHEHPNHHDEQQQQHNKIPHISEIGSDRSSRVELFKKSFHKTASALTLKVQKVFAPHHEESKPVEVAEVDVRLQMQSARVSAHKFEWAYEDDAVAGASSPPEKKGSEKKGFFSFGRNHERRRTVM